MSYSIRLRGEIRIDPPLRWREFHNHELQILPRNSQLNVKFYVDTTQRETDEGALTIRTAHAIIPKHSYPTTDRNIEAQVQSVVNAFPTRTFSGAIMCYGEEPGDIRKLMVVDGIAKWIYPRIVWPDGTEGLDDFEF